MNANSGGGAGTGAGEAQDNTVHVSNLDEKVDEPLLKELFTQMAPVVKCTVVRDKVTRDSAGFGFVTFRLARDAEYAAKMLDGLALFGWPIRCSPPSRRGREKTGFDIGAKLFVGNLEPSLDEEALVTVFARFGTLLGPPRIVRRTDAGGTEDRRGLTAFVNFATFEAADAALDAVNGSMLGGRAVRLEYALKEGGGRHGSEAERQMASLLYAMQRQQQQMFMQAVQERTAQFHQQYQQFASKS